jgi:small-conductance mechanosensitive channel
MAQILAGWQTWARALGFFFGALLVALLLHHVLFRIARRLVSSTTSNLDNSLVRQIHAPTRLILPLIALIAATPALPLSPDMEYALRRLLGLGLVGGFAWLLIALLRVFEDFIAYRFRIDISDNLSARRIRTQMHVLHRVLVVLICVIAVSVGLMTFPSIRQIGASLLASAGLAGLVIGLAARPVIANVLAGLQLALAEPMRLDDVVIVEGEWGRIEEITTTYIVVRIWDLRRLVVPLSYFIEKPFQNWTRTSSELLGTVFLYTDYNVPVEEVRQELHRILQDSGMWDGKVWNLQVTNATERTLELRALMSAPDSGTAWELRCHVREKLIELLQRRYPESLPRMRAEVDAVPEFAKERREDGGLPGGGISHPVRH